jgi:outer membrane autotransporter protein
VAGDVAFATGSIFDVELLSTGATDLLDATGAATIATGAVLRFVKLDAPRFVLGRRYTVLSADAGRTGTFVLSGPTRVSQFISVVAEYDANNAYLGVRQTSSFASAGGTPNQIAAATGVDNAGNGALFTAIAYLPDAASARAAFDLVSGEIHASIQGLTFEDTRFVREAVGSRLASPGDDREAIWFHGYGAWGNWDGDGNAADVDRDISGFFMGADTVIADRFTIGILGGYGRAEIEVGDRASEATAKDFHLGGYAGFGSAGAIQGSENAAGLSARLGLANMWRDISTTRQVAIPDYVRTVTGDYDASVFQVFGELGYRFDMGTVGLEPFGGFAYIDVSSDGFREQGGEASLANAEDMDRQYWMSQLGGRAYLGLPVGGGRFGVTGSAAWRHAGGDVNDRLAMRFASGPAFAISGVPIAEDAAALAVSVTGKIRDRFEIDFGYSGQIGGGMQDHGVRGSVLLKF